MTVCIMCDGKGRESAPARPATGGEGEGEEEGIWRIEP